MFQNNRPLQRAAVTEAPVTMDVTTLDEDGNPVIAEDVTYTCTSTPYTLADTPEDIVIYDPDRSVLYPGAFVQGKSYVVGSIDALTIPERAPLRISIPDVASTTGDNFRTVTPNQAEVSNAIGNIVGNAVLDGLSTPSSIDFKMETYHSESQFALAAQVSGNYLGFSGSASGSIDRNASETTIAVQFTQRMYTVAVERPASDPASFFSEDFTSSDLESLRSRGQIGPDNLPVYVSEVVYGRMMMFTLTSTESESDIRATLQAAYDGIGGSVQGSLSARQQSLLQNSKVAITSYGGEAEATLAMIKSGNWADYFTANAPLSSASPVVLHLPQRGRQLDCSGDGGDQLRHSHLRRAPGHAGNVRLARGTDARSPLRARRGRTPRGRRNRRRHRRPHLQPYRHLGQSDGDRYWRRQRRLPPQLDADWRRLRLVDQLPLPHRRCRWRWRHRAGVGSSPAPPR